MTKTKQNKTVHKGIFAGIKLRLQKNRLGELLVIGGFISQNQLQQALVVSKYTGKTLGTVLIDGDMVNLSVIRQKLIEQFILRFLMTFLTIFISLASISTAKASSIKDVPIRIAFEQASAIAPIGQYPKLFGSTEKESKSLSAFTKWTQMFERFDAALNTPDGQATMNGFKAKLDFLKGQPMNKMVVGVNDIVNSIPYINDSDIYGKSDLWATPIEFIKNGGDCEDFAITKYVALRALGVPENRMRILVLQDMQKNIPHAILIVYTDNGPVLLDNQIKTVTNIERVSHYKPIFSINRESWWLHTKPNGNVTVVASASR